MIRHNNWVVPWLPHTKNNFSVTGPFGSVSNLGVEENSFFFFGGGTLLLMEAQIRDRPERSRNC